MTEGTPMRLSLEYISDMTGFDRGDKFTHEQQVIDYFKLDNIGKDPFTGKFVFTQEDLDDMAAVVIAHSWHFEDVVLTLKRGDARAIAEALELLAGIDEGENTDYDELRRLAALVQGRLDAESYSFQSRLPLEDS